MWKYKLQIIWDDIVVSHVPQQQFQRPFEVAEAVIAPRWRTYLLKLCNWPLIAVTSLLNTFGCHHETPWNSYQQLQSVTITKCCVIIAEIIAWKVKILCAIYGNSRKFGLIDFFWRYKYKNCELEVSSRRHMIND